MTERDDTTPYHGYSVDEETQLQPQDTLVDRDVDDVLDEGYAAPENWSPGEKFGNTALEEAHGESLDQRMIQEEPDPALEELKQLAEEDDEDATNPAGVEINADLEGEGELIDDEVGDVRAGRLVETDQGAHIDTEGALVADDEGIAGGAASAEEAAVHVIPDED